MISSPAKRATLSLLAGKTWHLLQGLGIRTVPLVSNLRSARSERCHLRAIRWELGSTQAPLAECRIVRITGPSVDIVNTMVFPLDPERLPVFAAELLVFGNRPQLVFVDLQVPGLNPDMRGRVSGVAATLARQYASLPTEPPPDWAVAFSTGGFVFTRCHDQECLPQLRELYFDYLRCWRDLALAGQIGSPGPLASAELARYKREHVAHSPGRPFLARMFGSAWTDAFLNDFLYR